MSQARCNSDRDMPSKPSENEGWIKCILDCPETLEEFGKTVLKLLTPTQDKNTRLN